MTEENARKTVKHNVKPWSLQFQKTVTRIEDQLSRRDLGYLFGLGINSMTRMDIDKKMRDPSSASFRNANKSDVLSIQLLELLLNEGWDVKAFEFDVATGELIKTPAPTGSSRRKTRNQKTG